MNTRYTTIIGKICGSNRIFFVLSIAFALILNAGLFTLDSASLKYSVDLKPNPFLIGALTDLVGPHFAFASGGHYDDDDEECDDDDEDDCDEKEGSKDNDDDNDNTGAPYCNGKKASVYVKNGIIFGGPDSGFSYEGTLRGGSGNQVIVGTEGDDLIRAESGNDTICALGGNDIIFAGSGNDDVWGGPGNNQIAADSGDDKVLVEGGNNLVCASSGNDYMKAGDGDNILDGDSGNDTFIVGNGNNIIYKGSGSDHVETGSGVNAIRNGSASECDGIGEPAPENQKPTIILLGNNPINLTVGDTFADPGATASDPEDGDITDDIVVGGDTVDTNTVGTYTITYNVTDSDGKAADEVTRTVTVNELPAECFDEIDNDGDGFIDLDDPDCETTEDDDENGPPVITLVGDNPLHLIIGNPFVDPGATAEDLEDGDLTDQIVVGGDVVDINTISVYTITYDVEDSEGVSAETKTREVHINPEVTECNDGEDNDGDGAVDLDDSGCDSEADNSENTPPVITLLGDNPLMHAEGYIFVDPSATAEDVEDGNLTSQIVVGGDTIDMNTPIGMYTITYDVTDSDGAEAEQVTRTVKVIPDPELEPLKQCSDEEDNDGDGFIDIEDSACHTDGDAGNADSYDPEIDDENSKPVLTLLGNNPINLTVGDTFADPGATASDPEDGDITDDIVVGGDTVDTNTVGTYTITYNVTDSDGKAADEVTRTVTVNESELLPECSDGIDNDDDNQIDYPDDSGCENAADDDENAPPVITLVGDASITLTVGDSFTDPGATASDPEDGDITDDIVVGGDTVNTNNAGIYTITYNVTDSDGASAPEVMRTVTVNTPPAPVSTPTGGGGGGGGGTVISGPLSIGFQAPGGQVAGAVAPIPVPRECPQYLFGFIKAGQVNDSTEVRKLQTFLRTFEGFSNVQVTGVYDQVTQDAVDVFQERYFNDILLPWGHDKATTYVYLTTRKKVNEIYCRGEKRFPLTAVQQEEVREFRAWLESLKSQTPINLTQPTHTEEEKSEGELKDIIDESIGSEDTSKTQPAIAGVAAEGTGVLQDTVNKVLDFFKRIRDVF